MAKAQISIPLDIPDVRVLKSEMNNLGELIITIESTKNTANCRQCGKELQKLHGYGEWARIRYLPVFGHPTYLRYRPKRYRCDRCQNNPTTTQQLDWHEPNTPNSFAYEQYILLQLVNSTISDVSIKENLAYDSVLGILERNIAAQVDWLQITSIGVLGLDEIALKKGHRDYVVVVTARKKGRIRVLAVLANREKDSVIDFLRSIPERLKKTITSACSDMYEGYTEAVREELPGVRLVIDRFHVAKHYREGFESLRLVEMKRLKRTLSEAEYKALKGCMWILRKKTSDLTPEERKTLQALFGFSPALKTAYDLLNHLTEIFNSALAFQDAEKQIRNWMRDVVRSRLDCFDDFIETLSSWWQEILNYFTARENSGFVEGLNNKIKVLKRRCYGITNLCHLFQRIYLDIEGYRLFA